MVSFPFALGLGSQLEGSREEAARSLHRVERKACRQPGHRWRRGDKDTHTVVQGEHRQS